MTFYGLADARLADSCLGEVVDLFLRREDAERALADVVADEPTWQGELYVVSVDLPLPGRN